MKRSWCAIDSVRHDDIWILNVASGAASRLTCGMGEVFKVRDIRLVYGGVVDGIVVTHYDQFGKYAG